MPVEPLSYIGAIAATLAAVGTAVKKAIIPMWKGLRSLARFNQEIIEGAQLAKRELEVNSGNSIKDKVDFVAGEAQDAKRKADEAKRKAEKAEEEARLAKEQIRRKHGGL